MKAAPTLSVQEQKEADDAAHAAAVKAERLQVFLAKLEAIRHDYRQLVQRNAQLPPEKRLGEQEMELDASLREALVLEKQRRVKEAGKKYVLATAREDAKTEKLRHCFVSNLLCDRFQLLALEEDLRSRAGQQEARQGRRERCSSSSNSLARRRSSESCLRRQPRRRAARLPPVPTQPLAPL